MLSVQCLNQCFAATVHTCSCNSSGSLMNSWKPADRGVEVGLALRWLLLEILLEPFRACNLRGFEYGSGNAAPMTIVESVLPSSRGS